MSDITLKMDLFAGLVMTDIKIWNKRKNQYSNLSIVIDTGASVTTISKDILFRAGYDVSGGNIRRITTASGIEYVKEVHIEKMMLSNYELDDVLVYAHTFPQESFSSGVLGLNILTKFNVNMLFDEQLIKLTKIVE